ncbi:hypothetical protein ACPFP2_12630 [Micromonospora citrea]
MVDDEFPATAAGDEDLRAWLSSFVRLLAVEVERSSSYGAYLARHQAP